MLFTKMGGVSWKSLNPISVWEFNETSGSTCIDATGFKNGTYSNVTLNQTGKLGTSALIAPSGKSVVTNDINYSVGNLAGTADSPFSINAIVKLTDKTLNSWIVNKRQQTGQGSFEYQLTLFAGVITFLIGDGITNATNSIRIETPVSSSGIQNNVFFHICVTFDPTASPNNTRLSMYIDGIKQTVTYIGTGTYTCSKATTEDFTMCNFNSAALAFNLKGYVDQISVFRKCLNQSEVNYLYNGGDGRAY